MTAETIQDTFWGSTPGQVTAGEKFDISINDPSQAGETITVSVFLDDGTPGTPPSVDITLDQDGKGSEEYTAPTDSAWIELVAEGDNTKRVDIT